MRIKTASSSKCRSSKSLVGALVLFLQVTCATASVQLPEPQKLPATHADILARQALGRVVVASDGSFFLYEWGQPYLGWVPETRWMASVAARRLQTFLYVVDLVPEAPTSQYLFYPNAGCSYWLGDLSWDNKYVIVYELDHDDRRVRVGAWSFGDKKMLWFGSTPDEAKIEEATVWISNEEFVYPSKGSGALLMRASVASGEERICADCSMASVRSARSVAAVAAAGAVEGVSRWVNSADVPKGAKILAGSKSGSLAVFAKDDSEELALLYERREQPLRVLFNNKRQEKSARQEGE